jgi:SNF2 family DNA or RNA helicase
MSLAVPYEGFVYHPHQATALEWMRKRERIDAQYVRGGILADEMGLGKTWMTLGLLLNEQVPNTLLLVPPVLQPQWAEALARCGIPHRVLLGGGKWKTVAGVKPIKVTLATYDRCVNNTVLVTDEEYQRIVCDEGHVLRNGPAIRRFRSTAAIEAPRRWILSGTPVQNTKSDFHNLVKWLGMADEERIRVSTMLIAAEVILRRTVGDVREAVADMPDKPPTHIVHPLVMPLGAEEERVFSALVGRFNHAIEVHAKNTIILELYLRIQQFLAHPAVYVDAMKRKYKGHYVRESWPGTATKMGTFAEWLRSEEAKPTIVFTTFRMQMDLAAGVLEDAGYKVHRICGGMTDGGRTLALDESRTAAGAGQKTAIVVQIVAGSAGLNLQHCERVVFLSSHWNPAIVDQAVARAYRMGQTKEVTVHHFLMADGADRNIDRIMAGRHGLKRATAIGVHPKLYCEAAADTTTVMATLNAVMPVVGTTGNDAALPHVEAVEEPIEEVAEVAEDPE